MEAVFLRFSGSSEKFSEQPTGACPEALLAVLDGAAFHRVGHTRAPVGGAVGAFGLAEQLNEPVGAAAALQFLEGRSCALFVVRSFLNPL